VSKVADFLSLFLPWSHPSLIYEVTSRCNLRCLHCYNVWKDEVAYPTEELGTERSLELVRRSVRQSRCGYFTFTGGEPLLREDLEALVFEATRHYARVNIITNGTLLPEERIKSLIAAGVDLFELPLNSSERGVHNMLAGGLECFDKVTLAAAQIRKHGGKFAFVFVATKHNIDGAREALELGGALGASGFLFNRYNAGGECHRKPEDLMPSLEQLKRALAEANAYSELSGIGIGASIALPPCLIDHSIYPKLGFGYCAAGTKHAYYTLDPVGNVRPCNHTPTVLGNIFETSLKKMSRCVTLRRFMEARPALCSGCRLELECQGGCKAAAEACYGSLHEPEPFLKLNTASIAKLIMAESPVASHGDECHPCQRG